MDKLTDLSRGIERLVAGKAALGDAAYSVLCRELNLASDSIDDIPDRDTLRVLVERVEEQARSKAPDCCNESGIRANCRSAREAPPGRAQACGPHPQASR